MPSLSPVEASVGSGAGEISPQAEKSARGAERALNGPLPRKTAVPEGEDKPGEGDDAAGTELMEIRLSVRELVEFLLRSGDIDRRRGTSPEKLMQEGSRLHRMIQRGMGEAYRAEVPLRTSYATEHCLILLDGRADGIIDEQLATEHMEHIGGSQISLNQYLTCEEYPQITIDEIKCVQRSLRHITAPVPVHLAQAKVYAHIYASQHQLPLIRVRMTYCHIETEELKYFFEEYSASELQEWFDGLMQEYTKWAEQMWAWRKIRQSSIMTLQFPFVYRPGQRQLAAHVYKNIREGKKLYLEAPTGTGKTLSTLFPSVKSMGDEMTEKIFYLTAKTITRTVAADAIELMRQNGLRIKSLVITAREKICPLEKCDCDPEHCPCAKGHFDRINDAVFHIITNYDCLDRETIALTARQFQVCPFELSLDLSWLSDILICDYNYVFDPHASLKRFFGDNSRGDYVFLVDEAHNLVERGREMYSAELCKEDFLTLKRTLNECVDKHAAETKKKNRKIKGLFLLPKLIRGLERCNRELLEYKRECEKYCLLESADTFAGALAGLNTAMGEFLDEEENTGVREEVLEFYFEIGHFLLIYERLNEDYRIYTENREKSGFWLKLLCVNPAGNLSECMGKGRASVLFSATLLPIQYYKKLLGAKEDDSAIYAESSFNKENLSVFIGKDVTSRYRQRNPHTYMRIAEYIHQITRIKEGNYLVFFPSYSFMSEVHDMFIRNFISDADCELLMQNEGMSEEEREAFLARFSTKELMNVNNLFISPVKKKLIGFCVLGGVFSEGIDLKEDALIGSIIIGVGFPGVCTEREIIKEFFGDKGFDYAYRYPGMNKVLQAAGRVIRSENDRGIVALLDERFLDRSYQRMFPREWSGFLLTDLSRITEGLSSFWGEDGDED